MKSFAFNNALGGKDATMKKSTNIIYTRKQINKKAKSEFMKTFTLEKEIVIINQEIDFDKNSYNNFEKIWFNFLNDKSVPLIMICKKILRDISSIKSQIINIVISIITGILASLITNYIWEFVLHL